MKIKSLSIMIYCGCLAFFLSSNIACADNQPPSSQKYTRNSILMEVDLKKNVLVVGEKYIYLLSSGKGSEKRWSTQFLNANHTPINPQLLKVPDKVLVEGEINDSGKIIADKVILMEKKEPFQATKNDKKKGDTLHKKNGVWTN